MKKKLLLVLFPVVLLVTGALAVWGDEQKTVQPGCGNCAKMQQQAPCANCPKAAAIEKGAAPCANCPKAAAADQGAPCANCPKQGGATPCANCPKQGAAAQPGCDKCAKGAAAQPACDKCQKLKGAEAAPAAGCPKCAKLQQDKQPADQPVQKECCKKKAL
ncbi:hypothetical protein KP005_16340 [Geomonas nitrogeniifigens]|uniref:Uncharacterized protein n=1 Tax=Geomonas diazotrophica TaxID=2843197 RepID=A0ABX8JIB7_9BACT|nr:hypothetical protein [Geomonas nitrogeniifigens]QWV96901.1 hypothetical protein KP005_16340 [Geomonas nitrogeniifigens]